MAPGQFATCRGEGDRRQASRGAPVLGRPALEEGLWLPLPARQRAGVRPVSPGRCPPSKSPIAPSSAATAVASGWAVSHASRSAQRGGFFASGVTGRRPQGMFQSTEASCADETLDRTEEKRKEQTMTAVMPLTVDPGAVRAIVGAVSPTPGAGWPSPEHRRAFSAVRRGWRRLKAWMRSIANRAHRHRGDVETRPGQLDPSVTD